MNPAQRTAALIVRLAGFALVVAGLIRLVVFLVAVARVHDASAFPAGLLWAAILWTVGGALLLVAGRPIGEWLGRDLG